MGKWRNISDDARLIGYGIPVMQLIESEAVATVSDDADEAYDNQPSIWERVSDAPASPSASAAPPAPTSASTSTDAAAS